MAVDLSTMNKKQLEKLQKDVEKAISGLKKKEMREARKAAEKAAAKFGYSLDEVTGAPAPARRSAPKAPRAASPAKYANPDDPKQTWTGKGRQPKWFKAAVDAGKDPTSMEI